jgi:nucleotide-binding universal stress UspA family protein
MNTSTPAASRPDAIDTSDEALHELAARLDLVAEQLDMIDEPVPLHADLLREQADTLVELAGRRDRDEVHVRRELERATHAAGEWARHVARSFARRLLGQRMFERVADVSVILGELALVAWEEELAERGELPVGDEQLDRFDWSGMRVPMRVIARGFDWARGRELNPLPTREQLQEAIGAGIREAGVFDGPVSNSVVMPVSTATRIALDQLLDTWLEHAPSELVDELADASEEAGRARATTRRDEETTALWFELGVALAVAWALLESDDADGAACDDAEPRLPVTGSVFEWLACVMRLDVPAA